MPEPTNGSQLSLSDTISRRSSVSRRLSRASLRSDVSDDSEFSDDSCRDGTPGSAITTMGGLEVVFLEPLDKKYECVVCTQVLRYPVQFETCGHYCCSSCLSELCRILQRCPIDQSPVSRDKVFVDTEFRKEISELPVKCPYFGKGCEWEGILEENKEHLDTCMYAEVECPNECGAKFEKRFLSSHVEEDCTKRTVQCEFCEKTVFYKDEIAHMNACKRFPVPCPNGCRLRTDIPRGEVKEHIDKDCPKAKILCPFGDMGCDYKCERQRMRKHISDEPTEHLSLVGKAMAGHRGLITTQQEMLAEHKESLGVCVQKVRDLEKLYGSQLVWKIGQYAERFQEAKTGKKITIFSPPFLTSRHGYKMAMSVCLNGDGKAKGHFVSVFISICKGEYDALLPWPFSHRCTFTLIDQCQDPSARRNVSYTIKPNAVKDNKAFLGRPAGERNASFGTQKFVPLNVMKTLDYIRDDTMFLKVHIDYDNMILL